MVRALILFFLATKLYAFPATPNPERNPGHLCSTEDADFLEFRYSEKIPYCKRNVSKILKDTVYAAYGVPFKEQRYYTIDHIIPLSIGGSNDFLNLWPEHKAVKETRPTFEVDLYWKIKRGEITQADAIKAVLKEKFNK